jgi:hypothetical protein
VGNIFYAYRLPDQTPDEQGHICDKLVLYNVVLHLSDYCTGNS